MNGFTGCVTTSKTSLGAYLVEKEDSFHKAFFFQTQQTETATGDPTFG